MTGDVGTLHLDFGTGTGGRDGDPFRKKTGHSVVCLIILRFLVSKGS